jgi:ribosomal protein S12 methylthiotransferase accessory factor YcaO
LDERLTSHALAGLGPVTVGHGVRLDFELAVITTLAEMALLNRRHERGAWVDQAREHQVWADIEHLHWLAEFRETRR